MTIKVGAVDFINSLWNFFTSVKLTVVLLLSIAITSIFGTLIPQNKNPDAYFRVYGDFLFRFFDLLDIFDMYHSFWFQFLILLLTLNIVVCSIERLSATWKIVFTKTPKFNLSGFRKLSQKETFDSRHSLQSLRKKYETFISRRFGHTIVEETKKGFCIFTEKWRWTRFGVYIVHLSIILLLMGSLIGSIFGFEGFVNISEGEAINKIQLVGTGKIIKLDFEIRCDDFNISYYKNGSPKEYRSSLTIIDGGMPVIKKDIIVNDPLRYKGINIFQSSFGKIPTDPGSDIIQAEDPDEEISLKFVNNESGVEYKVRTKIGNLVALPEELGTFVVEDYIKAATYGGKNIGEAYVGTLTPKNGDPVKILLPIRFPNLDKMRKGAVIISLETEKAKARKSGWQSEMRYYTGLQVIKDPGVWVVYSGFIGMIIGLFITFFMSHQRFCVEVVKSGRKNRIIITGRSNRNKLGIHSRIKKIAQSLLDLEQKA